MTDTPPAPDIPVLTIDGPSGSGKGTISRAVAARTGWNYLDSGALYRAVGVAAGWGHLDLSDASALVRCTFDTRVSFREEPGSEPRVLVNGVDATAELRTETAGAAASAKSYGPPGTTFSWTGPNGFSSTSASPSRSRSAAHGMPSCIPGYPGAGVDPTGARMRTFSGHDALASGSAQVKTVSACPLRCAWRATSNTKRDTPET